MRVHHLNCATMCPPGSRWIHGRGGVFSSARVICHCLLIETNAGLVLVDTGLGVHDVTAPKARLSWGFRALVRPRLQVDETAVSQIKKLGFFPRDVRHIVLTHLDVDHAGGLPDFPEAQVHLLASELDAANARRTLIERMRYVPAQWAHGPAWVAHPAQGESWHGFDAVRALGELGDDILLVPLSGHTRGHAGVAVRTSDGWLLHAGDAFFHHDELEATPRCPVGLRFFQWLVQVDRDARWANQARLRELAHAQSNIRVICAHDPYYLDQLASEAKAERSNARVSDDVSAAPSR